MEEKLALQRARAHFSQQINSLWFIGIYLRKRKQLEQGQIPAMARHKSSLRNPDSFVKNPVRLCNTLAVRLNSSRSNGTFTIHQLRRIIHAWKLKQKKLQSWNIWLWLVNHFFFAFFCIKNILIISLWPKVSLFFRPSKMVF